MKKFMMIPLVAIGFIVIATPESNAGVSIGIGLGLPVGFCGYPMILFILLVWLLSVRRRLLSACYLLQQRKQRPYYWWHGRRIFVRHRHFR